jgi:hypothetical protein
MCVCVCVCVCVRACTYAYVFETVYRDMYIICIFWYVCVYMVGVLHYIYIFMYRPFDKS